MTQKQNTKTTNSIVILYTELAGYTITCIEALSSIHGVSVHIFNYPTNTEAPFQFNKSQQQLITYYNRPDFDAKKINQVINFVNPFLIYCAGWSDKTYLEVVKSNHKQIPTLLGFDNQWVGSLKQRLSILYAKLFITPYFNYAFVPGNRQKTFAQKLGFKTTHIIEGAYSANVIFFNDVFNSTIKDKEHHFPHRFIFVGRYVKAKAIEELWTAFIEVCNSQPNDWELWCLGVGNIPSINHPKIKHFGFVQPSELIPYLKDTGVFILPSKFEPWAVVVHEFAAAGYPLLLSKHVGAKDQFLYENENGYSFDSKNIPEIKLAILNTINKSDSELFEMGKQSHKIAQSITPKTWADSLFRLQKVKIHT